ncbi:hypothetical protein GCM10017786_72930 [Amycolatopsis deserti]|uniref:Uncharacterized protein n=1 Tax=Amycolatopsis deserti TaxID=185696 RepID=A0ABQ3JG52_9PSEU|nr:hypothetical protein GCM10017786_72930 [Amycolatopsis deserti]
MLNERGYARPPMGGLQQRTDFVLAWAATSSGVRARGELAQGSLPRKREWWSFIVVPVAVINLWFTAANKAPL